MSANRNTPLHVRFVSAFFFISASTGILRFSYRVLMGNLSRYHYMSHIGFHLFLQIAEPLLELVGSILLWRLDKLSRHIFTAEALLGIGSSLFLSFISPGIEIEKLKMSHLFWPIFGFGITYELIRVLYVFWVTSSGREANDISNTEHPQYSDIRSTPLPSTSRS